MADNWDRTPTQKQEYLPTGEKAGSQQQVGSGTESSSGVQRTSQSTSTANMTSASLQALDALIQQLSDHPVVSDALATAQLNKSGIKPPSQVVADRVGADANGRPMGSGITWTDEHGRPVYTFAEFQAAQQRYIAAKQQIIEAGGIAPGGTAETRAQSAARQNEIKRTQALQGGYSKDAAFTDATALTSKFARVLAEQMMPTLLRAQEAAGASGAATGALIANDMTQRVSESAASLGLTAAVDYGKISTALESTLELLTRENNPALTALIQSLGVAKGAIQNTTQSTTQTGSQDVSKTQSQNTTSKEQQIGDPKLTPNTTVTTPAPVQTQQTQQPAGVITQISTGAPAVTPTTGAQDDINNVLRDAILNNNQPYRGYVM